MIKTWTSNVHHWTAVHYTHYIEAHVHRNKDLTQENDMASNKTRMQVIMPNLKRV